MTYWLAKAYGIVSVTSSFRLIQLEMSWHAAAGMSAHLHRPALAESV